MAQQPAQDRRWAERVLPAPSDPAARLVHRHDADDWPERNPHARPDLGEDVRSPPERPRPRHRRLPPSHRGGETLRPGGPAARLRREGGVGAALCLLGRPCPRGDTDAAPERQGGDWDESDDHAPGGADLDGVWGRGRRWPRRGAVLRGSREHTRTLTHALLQLANPRSARAPRQASSTLPTRSE